MPRVEILVLKDTGPILYLIHVSNVKAIVRDAPNQMIVLNVKQDSILLTKEQTHGAIRVIEVA